MSKKSGKHGTGELVKSLYPDQQVVDREAKLDIRLNP